MDRVSEQNEERRHLEIGRKLKKKIQSGVSCLEVSGEVICEE